MTDLDLPKLDRLDTIIIVANPSDLAELDAERHEQDRALRRGYDYDATAPSNVEYVSCADPLSGSGHPAYSIIATCRRSGVALRIDPDGTLIVGRAGAKSDEPTQPWPSLLIAIETHLEAIAALVEEGWSLRADFPQGEVA